MNTVFKIMTSVLALAAGTAAQATTLTFDDLWSTYGDGNPLGANMTGDMQYLSYAESGFVLTLHTSNAPDNWWGAHIGDGTSTPQTFNWHDGADNAYGAYVTLSKLGGGSFNLSSFDYLAYGDFAVSAIGYSTLNLPGYESGTATANFLNVNSVTFYGSGSQQLDNINVTAGVPEPASWAMMLVGFGAVGGAMRSRGRTAVRFA
jgi:hypothetical protein